MSRITIRSNIASLNVQRRLTESSSKLSSSFDRLSSGLRINKARDDAAGLAIAESLRTDSAVFQQGVRNINDGISLLNITEGALQELSNILTRQIELATQSSNGVLSAPQRTALNEEANALVDEYNRIVESIDFNGFNPIDPSSDPLRIQGGYGETGSITVNVGDDISRFAGDGTFQASQVFTGASDIEAVNTGDLNGDGKLDVVAAVKGNDTVGIYYGNGNGSFQAIVTLGSVGNQLRSVKVADLNGDGKDDIVTGDQFSSVFTYLGNGNGTFAAQGSYEANSSEDIQLGDLNSDGYLDIVSTGQAEDRVGILFGNSDGTFGAQVSYSVGDIPDSSSLADLDGDGDLDIVTTARNDNTVNVLLNQGGGTFGTQTSFAAGSGPYSVNTNDFNNDGKVDLAVASLSDSRTSILIGNGDGTFQARLTISSGVQPFTVNSSDLNEDGNADLIVGSFSETAVSILYGNGDGTFQDRLSYSSGSRINETTLGDVDGDGVNDIITANYATSSIAVFAANATETARMASIDLLSQINSREEMDRLGGLLTNVSSELGTIGSFQSRLSVAANNLQQGRESFDAAASAIRDVDVAVEAAKLTQTQILQQASVSVLAQANLGPGLALRLLEDI